jgi:hypothetical protein
MFYRRYKAGLTQEDGEFLRKLRSKGFAVVVFNPVDVGDPMHRKPVEDEMLRAGKDALKNIKKGVGK